MPIIPMEKVNIFSLSVHKGAVLDLLQKREIIQIENLKERTLPESVFLPSSRPEEVNYELELADLNFAVNFLTKMKGEKTGLIETFLPRQIGADEEDLFLCFKEFDHRELVKKCKSIDSELSNLKNLRSKLITDLERLLPWRELDAKLADISSSNRTTSVVGIQKIGLFPLLKDKLSKLFPAIHIEEIKRTKTDVYLFLLFLKEDAAAVNDVLKKNGFNEASLEVSRETPGAEIDNIRTLLKQTSLGIEELQRKGAALAGDLFKLMCAHDYLLQKKALLDARGKLLDSKYTFILEGWIPKRKIDELKAALREISPETECIKVLPEKGEEPPVALDNSRAMKPLETIIRIYGLPRYKNIDPTPFLSLFFVAFFGICLGDAGYGITLALLSFLITKRSSIKQSTKTMLHLLMYGGLASAIAGVLTGAWFGVNLDYLPGPLKWVGALQVIDPVKDPIFMLVLALMLGVIQIIFGIAIQMFINLRDGSVVDALLDDLLWIVFIALLVVFAFAKAGSAPAQLGSLSGYLITGGAALLVLTQGRRQKNILLKAAVGILSLYKIVGYFSDVLSYSRLLALGLATTVIAMVVNLIGQMALESAPVIGVLIALMIFIFGHLFNLVISSLGAFIHSGRLQFAEFFSKFIEGGGKEFKPFSRETKYINIQ